MHSACYDKSVNKIRTHRFSTGHEDGSRIDDDVENILRVDESIDLTKLDENSKESIELNHQNLSNEDDMQTDSSSSVNEVKKSV